MTPDAERRMNVYQEGQRASGSGASCPYTDWRAGTWMKGFEAAHAYREKLFRQTVAPAPTADETIPVPRELLERIRDREYNSFEPDNQSDIYNAVKDLLE